MKKVKATEKTSLPDLSASQLEIMQEVWKQDETTVSDVWEALLAKRKIARNTVLTVMDRLTQKGWLKRRLQKGLHLYSATTARKRTLGEMVNQMVDKAFAGSSEDLVLSLLESRGLTREESERIQTLIQNAEKKASTK